MKLSNILKEEDSLKKMAAEVVSILKKQWKFKSVGKVKVVPLGVSITLGDSKEGEQIRGCVREKWLVEEMGTDQRWQHGRNNGCII